MSEKENITSEKETEIVSDENKTAETDIQETAEENADKEETVSENDPEDKKKALKQDKQYKKGGRIYDIGMWTLTLYLLAIAAKGLLKIEIIAGDAMISNYLSILVIIPIALMIIGLVISDNAAKKYDVKEQNRIWAGVLSVAGVMIIILSVLEILMPSYHIYSMTNYNGGNEPNSSQNFAVVEYANGTILNPAPNEKPTVRYLDVYAQYGIFAVKKVTARYGKYEIKNNGGNEYILSVNSLGREESFPFTY